MEVLGEEQGRSVECLIRLVERADERLEHVRHPGRDVENHIDARLARFPNPADWRSSLISLTTSGAALVAEAGRTFNDRLDELIAPAISAGQVDAARATIAALRRALEDARVGLPVG